MNLNLKKNQFGDILQRRGGLFYLKLPVDLSNSIKNSLEIIYFHWSPVEHEKQQQAGHIRLSGAVLICL